MPQPDLASNWSPLRTTLEMVMLVKIVSVTGKLGVFGDGYWVWNMIPPWVGASLSTLVTRIPRNSLLAENSQIAGKTWLPQKWPPARSIVMLSKVVGWVPKPTNGKPKFSELIVMPE